MNQEQLLNHKACMHISWSHLKGKKNMNPLQINILLLPFQYKWSNKKGLTDVPNEKKRVFASRNLQDSNRTELKAHSIIKTHIINSCKHV